jgi:hypothetical protein
MSRTDTCAPLLDLLRTAIDHSGEVTFRTLPADHEHAETGCVVPAERVICLAADRSPDDPAWLVQGLYRLVAEDSDPRLAESVEWFVADATARTLAAMGVAR